MREYGRGIAGGLMFSLPLLYTMEVWWAGFTLHPGRILGYMACTFVLLFLYNRFAGLRRDADLREVLGVGGLFVGKAACAHEHFVSVDEW